MNKSAIEHEIALQLGNSCANEAFAWLSHLANCQYQRTTQLLNVYFDTPNQDLRRAKAALRLRFDTEAQRWIQTLKTAGRSANGLSARQEWEVVLPLNADHTSGDSIGDQLPEWQFELFDSDAQAILQPLAQNLHAVFHTDFQRDIFDYRSGEDHFEFALDRGEVRTENDRHSTTKIKDLEIELIAGDLQRMQSLAEQVQAALYATPQPLSKAARGYFLLAGSNQK